MTVANISGFGRHTPAFVDAQLAAIANLLVKRENGHPVIPVTNRQLFEQFYYYAKDHADRIGHFANAFSVDDSDIRQALDETWALLHAHGVDAECGHDWLTSVIQSRCAAGFPIPYPDPFRTTWGSTPEEAAVMMLFRIIRIVASSDFTDQEKQIFRLTLGLGSDPRSSRQLAEQFGIDPNEIKGLMRRFWTHLRRQGIPSAWDSWSTRAMLGYPVTRPDNRSFVLSS